MEVDNPVKSPDITFTILWDIQWSEFREISTKTIKKFYSTAHNNVVYYWSIEIGVFEERSDEFGFYLRYRDGPLPSVKISKEMLRFFHAEKPVMKSEKWEASDEDYVRGGSGLGWPEVDIIECDFFREKYNFVDSRSLICQYTVEIPMAAFCFKFDIPPPIPSTPWMTDLFKKIDDPEKSVFSNAKLVSRDDRTFYCHRLVLEIQSPVLAAMFRHPTKEKDTYPFPMMGADSLKALLEFLYTGQVDLQEDVSTAAIMETADAAEQYGLQILMESCRAALWDRVVDNVADCIDIVQFSAIHEENLKYLKHRAFEVLAKNYSVVVPDGMTLAECFGDGEGGKKLVEEYNGFVSQRVQGYFQCNGN